MQFATKEYLKKMETPIGHLPICMYKAFSRCILPLQNKTQTTRHGMLAILFVKGDIYLEVCIEN